MVAGASLAGARYLAFTSESLASRGNRYLSVENEVASAQWHETASDNHASIQSATGNGDGELFGAFVGWSGPPVFSSWAFPWGTEGANLLVKWDSAGGQWPRSASISASAPWRRRTSIRALAPGAP